MLAVLLLIPFAPAHADSLQDCLDTTAGPNGEPPTCTDADDGFDASWSDDAVTEDDGFGGFIALFVVVGLIGVGVTVWQVSTARTLAKKSGMDPNLATKMALLTENGLDATYLAANLRSQTDSSAAQTPAPTTATASQRLTELKGLLDADLITQAEFEERRTVIIAGL